MYSRSVVTSHKEKYASTKDRSSIKTHKAQKDSNSLGSATLYNQKKTDKKHSESQEGTDTFQDETNNEYDSLVE